MNSLCPGVRYFLESVSSHPTLHVSLSRLVQIETENGSGPIQNCHRAEGAKLRVASIPEGLPKVDIFAGYMRAPPTIIAGLAHVGGGHCRLTELN
ncbi:MAG: hypothetical protein ABWZ40_01305 [Caulobacterales bacterium]